MSTESHNLHVMTYEELTRAGDKISKQAMESMRLTQRIVSANQYASALGGQIPLRYQAASLESSAFNKGVFKACRNYVLSFDDIIKTTGKSVLLWGGVGVGKTYLACAMLNALIKVQKTGMYMNCSELIAAVMASKSYQSEQTLHTTMQGITKPDLLVIDEIGLKNLTAAEVSVLASIIDSRYRSLKPIIAISNLPPERMRLVIGDMAYSRLTGHEGPIYELTGTDLRLTGNPVAKTGNPSVVNCLDESIFNDPLEIT